MATTASTAADALREFRLRVMLPVVLVTLAAIVLAALGMTWAASHSDAVSVGRQIREMQNAIKAGVDEVIQSQKMVTVWDDAVIELRRPSPDWEWVDDNMGFALRSNFAHNQFYILDAQDRPIYAMTDGARVEPSLYDSAQEAIKPFVDKVRGHTAPVPGGFSHDVGYLTPTRATQKEEPPLYAAGLVNVFRRPAAVSVMRNVPMTEKVSKTPGAEPVIICVRFLDGLFLLQLSNRHLIEAPRFSRLANPQPGEQVLPLMENEGRLLGYMLWRPELPGTMILRALGPITALTVGAMAVIMTLLARWLYRSMQQQRAVVDELKVSEAQAQKQSLHDALTGLPNRVMFSNRLDSTLAARRRAALLLLDLDRFKHVNDTLGHGAGDLLIREFGERLSALVRDRDIVARLGGDEFAILCDGFDAAEEIETLCERIVEAVRLPFHLMGNKVFVGVSIGVCAIPSGNSDRIDLMRKADIALYRAKAEGRDCHRVFTPAMDERVKTRGVVEDELRAALADGEGLMVHYQPQIRCADQQIAGLEALVRWRHPTRGAIPPQQFIAVAEEAGLIGALGEWVMREACRTSTRWPELFMAVNLSPAQFRTPGFAERMLAIARECGADPRRIELEVTEGVLLDDNTIVRAALSSLRAEGFHIALDDFGTGYSSLGYLRQFQVDKIKIDRSFIAPLWTSPDAAAIVTAVLTLGHAMGLTVVAEGVETRDQQQFLTAAGCDMMQGFLFSAAVPASSIERMLAAAEEARGAA